MVRPQDANLAAEKFGAESVTYQHGCGEQGGGSEGGLARWGRGPGGSRRLHGWRSVRQLDAAAAAPPGPELRPAQGLGWGRPLLGEPVRTAEKRGGGGVWAGEGGTPESALQS